MAENSRTNLSSLAADSYSLKLKEQLDSLECPFTKDMDDSAVAEMMFNPGEDRLKVMQWLFSKYDPKLADMLNPTNRAMEARTGSRLQRLLTAANLMCLCHPEDVTVVKGDSPFPQQKSFFDKLLGIICTRHKIISSSDSTSAHKDYISAVAGQGSFLDATSSQLDLLPRDICNEIDKMCFEENEDSSRSLRVPSIQSLKEQSLTLSDELKVQNDKLQHLQSIVHIQGEGKTTELLAMTQMLGTVVRELQQQMDGFTHCFETNIGLWCNKKPLEVSQLGLAFKRVHESSQKFTKVLEDIHKIRQLQVKLKDKKFGEELKRYMLIQASRSDPDSFQKFLTVLEETLHRKDSNFVSRFDNLFPV